MSVWNQICLFCLKIFFTLYLLQNKKPTFLTNHSNPFLRTLNPLIELSKIFVSINFFQCFAFVKKILLSIKPSMQSTFLKAKNYFLLKILNGQKKNKPLNFSVLIINTNICKWILTFLRKMFLSWSNMREETRTIVPRLSTLNSLKIFWNIIAIYKYI